MTENPEMPTTPFTAREAHARGITKGALSLAVRRRQLRRPFRGVYVPMCWPDDLEHRARVAAAVLRDDQVFIDRTAAWLHGIDVLGYAEREAVPRVETAVVATTRASRAEGVLGRKRDLADEDTMVARGVRLTTPLRTALDLACNLRRHDALGALDWFAREHGVTRQDLLGTLGRFRGRRGVIQARELVLLMDRRAESVRESMLRLAIIDAGFPAPELQHRVVVDGYEFWLDHAYPARRVAIEYDGEEFHSSPEQRRRDERRRALLRSEGWTCIVVKNGDFTGKRLLAWQNELRRALEVNYTTLRW